MLQPYWHKIFKFISLSLYYFFILAGGVILISSLYMCVGEYQLLQKSLKEKSLKEQILQGSTSKEAKEGLKNALP